MLSDVLVIVACSGFVYWWTWQGSRRAEIVYMMWQEEYPRPRPRWRRWLELLVFISMALFAGPFVRPWSRPHLERLMLALLLAIAMCVVLIVIRP